MSDRKPWGDPKWMMRRMFVIGVLVWCGGTFWMAMVLDLSADKITALSALLGSLSVIAMPTLVSYLGIAEAGQVIRDLKQPPGTTISQTTEVTERKPAPKGKAPKGDA
jgi:hypothetical protein